MKTLALAAATLFSLAAASTADARPLGGNCPEWMCGSNGTQLTGIAAQAIEAKQPVVNAVILPSGTSLQVHTVTPRAGR